MRLLLVTLALLTPVLGESGFLPVLMIEPITISAPEEYAHRIAEINSLMRERHNTPLYIRAYVRPAMTGSEPQGFALSPSASMSGLMAARAAFLADPTLGKTRGRLKAITSNGPASYLKAVRFDGTHTPGWLCNTLVRTADETALLERVETMAALLTDSGDSPLLINVFRFIAGPGPETHLVSINTASSADLATRLDRLLEHPDPLNATSITLISRTVFHELIP